MTATTARHRWRVRAAMLIMLYFTFIGGTFLTDQRLWPRIIHHALVTLGLLIWLAPSLWKHRTIPTTTLDLPLVALFASYCLAVVFAIDPRVSLESLWVMGFHTLLLYAVVALMRAWKPRTILEPLFFAASVVVFVSLYEFVAWYLGLGFVPGHNLNWLDIGGLRAPIPPQIYRLALTLGVSTNLSGYIALLIPVAVAWALATEKIQTRRMLLFWIMPALIVEVLTFSRGGFLSLAASLSLVAVAGVMSSTIWRDRALRLLRDRRVQIGLIAAFVVLGGLALVWFTQGQTDHQAGDELRFDLWRGAWLVGLGDPLTGAGPGGFGRAVRAVRDSRIAEDRFTSPHNIPLLIWAEAGLPGVLTFIWLSVMIALTAIRRWRDVASDRDRMRIVGVAAALVGFGVQNIFDTLIMTPNVLPVLILTGYLIYPYQSNIHSRFLDKFAVSRLVTIIVVLSGVGWFQSDRAQWHFNQSVRSLQRHEFDSALDLIDTARRLDPHMGYYQAQRAQILAEMSLHNPDIRPDALAAYQDFLAVEESYDVNHANYAQLLFLNDEFDLARDHLLTATRIYPRQARYMLWAGMLAEQQGDDEAAVAAYDTAMTETPHWVTSSFWDETDLRQDARQKWLQDNGLAETNLRDLDRMSSDCWYLLSVDPPVRDEPLCQAELAFRVAADLQTALLWDDRAIAEMPPEAVMFAYLHRAEVHLEMGEWDQAQNDALTALFLGERRANAVLGAIAEERGDIAQAIEYYSEGGPLLVQFVGWDVAVYARRGRVVLLDVLDAPGPSRYDFAAWLALADLYENEGRVVDAAAVRDRILAVDPYFDFSAGP